MNRAAIGGISHIVVDVSEPKRSEEFYTKLLGFEPEDLPIDGVSVVLKTASGQQLLLCQTPQPKSFPETGVHQAYRVARATRKTIAAKLTEQGIRIFPYKEDRPAEAEDNFYFYDPDGNRIQLVASENSGAPATIQGIDHAAVEVVDIEWAEDFYVNVLGLTVDCRVGWRTEDYVRAKLWGEGKEEMAPGSRRWDKRYTVMEQKRRLPRPNTHFFVRAGDAALGIYLATEHRQEPPEEQLMGSPRIALSTDASGLDAVRERLKARGQPFEGPVSRASGPIASSLYFKDPGGNFLELSVPR